MGILFTFAAVSVYPSSMDSVLGVGQNHCCYLHPPKETFVWTTPFVPDLFPKRRLGTRDCGRFVVQATVSSVRLTGFTFCREITTFPLDTSQRRRVRQQVRQDYDLRRHGPIRVIARHEAYALLGRNSPTRTPMNPTLHPPTERPRSRIAMPPPAFHSLRAFIPRQTMRHAPIVPRIKPPSYETRAFPVELTYMS